MLIKFVFFLFVSTFLLGSSVEAETNNYILGNNEHKITKRIDSFFAKHSNEKRVIWQPEIKGKSRYALSIPKDGYLTSKKYFDFSDLYYLSKKIDNGLNLHPNKLKYLDVIISKNNSKLSFNQNFFSNINFGLFLQQKEQKTFGLMIDKDFIILENILSNFGFVQTKGEYTAFNAKFVKFTNNENSEFFGNISHEFNSDILNMGIGHTWFEIAHHLDLSVGVYEHDKKIRSDFYATFGDEKIKIQVGLDQIKNNSSMNMFVNLKFENNLQMKKFGTNLTTTSKDSIFGLRNLSLKSLRRNNLDFLWKKHLNHN